MNFILGVQGLINDRGKSMNIVEAKSLLYRKFGTEGTREGNTLWVDALMPETGKLVRLVLVLGRNEEVVRLSIYPWHSDLDIPGTERNLREVLKRFH